jgi:hypothetical protein
MWWIVFIVSIASIPLAGKMAPVALLILGDAARPARAN